MTMGIVLVACLAARIVAKFPPDKHIDIELHEFGHKAWDAVHHALSVAILYKNVFPLDITEIAQPLPECFDITPGTVGIFIGCYVSYPRDFRRLLRVCTNAKREEHGAEHKWNKLLMHESPSAFARC